MGRATTRQPHIKPYEKCRTCKYDIEGYGKCQKGFDNFYYRKSKKHKCNVETTN